MPSGKFFIVGLGNIGLQLVRLLSKDLELVCIDTDPQLLQTVRQLRGERLTVVQGDATSRLVLEGAGVSAADTVVITTTSEKVNIEVARVLYDHFESPRVIAIGITQQGIEALEKLEVEVEGIFAVSATGLRNRLEHKAKTVHGIGLGKHEILEVEVHPHSRLANKPLAALNPKSWRVGIIYREGNILIPRGDAVLRAKDKVVILGDPKVLKTVSDLLTFRFKHFPLEYGDTLAVWVENGMSEPFLAEIDYLCSVFPLAKALFVCARPTEALAGRLREIGGRNHLEGVFVVGAGDLPPQAALRQALREQGLRPGLAVMTRSAAVAPPWSMSGRRRGKRFLRELSTLLGCPLLLAAGTFPYARVAVPCVETIGLQHAIETTLEMSAAINYAIEALLVGPSRYIGSEEETELFEAMEKAVSDLALVYRTTINIRELEGNPIKASTAALSGCNLMVTDICSWRGGSALLRLLQPDTAWEVVRRAPVSTLLIPAVEAIA